MSRDKSERAGLKADGIPAYENDGSIIDVEYDRPRGPFGIRNRKVAYFVTMMAILVLLAGIGVGAYLIARYTQRHQNSYNNNSPSNCVLTFGGFCGCTGNVAAYSNCNSNYQSNIPNFIEARQTLTDSTVRSTSVYTGMQFQCVEFARRFLINSSDFGRYLTFESVIGASDIFALKNLTSIFDERLVYEFETHVNGAAGNSAPAFGDLIIYPIQGTSNDFPYGHVAVVAYVNLTSMVVGVGEQNWNNNVWPVSAMCGTDSIEKPVPKAGSVLRQYAREIPLLYNAKDNSYRLQDHSYVIAGWKRAGAQW